MVRLVGGVNFVVFIDLTMILVASCFGPQASELLSWARAFLSTLASSSPKKRHGTL